MAIEEKLEILPGGIADIVTGVFDTTMGLETRGDGTPWFAGTDRLTSAVHLTGRWNGVVLLECDRTQARHFTGRFLGMEPPETVDGVVCDVLGELANIIGGNLKCTLSSGIRLSMPSVAEGSDFRFRICGAQPVGQYGFRCEEGLFWVTVLTTF